MRVALGDLALEHLWVVYPGDERYALDKRITALPVGDLAAWARKFAPSQQETA